MPYCCDQDPFTGRNVAPRAVCMGPIAPIQYMQPTWPTKKSCVGGYSVTPETVWLTAAKSRVEREAMAVNQTTGDGLMRALNDVLKERSNPFVKCQYDDDLLNFMRAFVVFTADKSLDEVLASADFNIGLMNGTSITEHMLAAGCTNQELAALRALLVTSTSGPLSALASLSSKSYFQGKLISAAARLAARVEFCQSILDRLVASNSVTRSRLNEGVFQSVYLAWCEQALVLPAISRAMNEIDHAISKKTYPNIVVMYEMRSVSKDKKEVSLSTFGGTLLAQSKMLRVYHQMHAGSHDCGEPWADGRRPCVFFRDGNGPLALDRMLCRLNYAERNDLFNFCWLKVKHYVTADPFDRHGMLYGREAQDDLEKEKILWRSFVENRGARGAPSHGCRSRSEAALSRDYVPRNVPASS